MTEQQTQYQTASTGSKVETCTVCGNSFTQKTYLDHLFVNRDCMRKYWEDEEKNHISRLRHRTSRSIVR